MLRATAVDELRRRRRPRRRPRGRSVASRPASPSRSSTPSSASTTRGHGARQLHVQQRRPAGRAGQPQTVPPTAATRSASPARPVPAAGSAPPRRRRGSPARAGRRPAAATTRPAARRCAWRRWPAPPRPRSRRSPRPPAAAAPAAASRRRRAPASGRRRPDGAPPAPVGQDLRVDAADQLPQLGQGLLRLLVRAAPPDRRRRSVGQVEPGQAELHGQRDQPLLGAVVQVAFDAPALGLERVDQPGPGPGQLDQLRVDVGRGGQDRPGHRRAGRRQRGHRVGAADQQDQPGRDGRGRCSGV